MLAFVWTLAAPVHNSRADAPTGLTWHAPDGCPTADAARRAIVELVSSSAAGTLRANVSIQAIDGQFRASVTMEDRSERTLVSPVCDDAAAAIVVILALAIDPGAKLAESSVRQSLRPRPAGETSPPTVPKPRQPPASGEPLRVAIGGGPSGELGVLPHATGGGTARAALLAHVWEASVEATYWLPVRGRLADGSSPGGDFSWWLISPRGCGVPFDGRWRLALCAGPEFGRIAAEGVDVSASRGASALWVAMVGDAALRLHLTPRVGLRTNLGGAVALAGRHPFVIDGAGTVHRPGLGSGRAGMGIDVFF